MIKNFRRNKMPEDHIVYTPKLELMLKKEFEKEATHEFLNLVRMAIAAHECAFQKSEITKMITEDFTKEKYLEWVDIAWDQGAQQECVNAWSNHPLIESVLATYKHASRKYGITKEKYLEWVNEAWDAGIYQRKVYNMEIEDCINNSTGVALNFGASLALWGREKGYITQTE